MIHQPFEAMGAFSSSAKSVPFEVLGTLDFAHGDTAPGLSAAPEVEAIDGLRAVEFGGKAALFGYCADQLASRPARPVGEVPSPASDPLDTRLPQAAWGKTTTSVSFDSKGRPVLTTTNKKGLVTKVQGVVHPAKNPHTKNGK